MTDSAKPSSLPRITTTFIAERFNALFKTLDTVPGNRGGLPPELADFPYVNGGIFEEKITLPTLDQDFRDVIFELNQAGFEPLISQTAEDFHKILNYQRIDLVAQPTDTAPSAIREKGSQPGKK